MPAQSFEECLEEFSNYFNGTLAKKYPLRVRIRAFMVKHFSTDDTNIFLSQSRRIVYSLEGGFANERSEIMVAALKMLQPDIDAYQRNRTQASAVHFFERIFEKLPESLFLLSPESLRAIDEIPSTIALLEKRRELGILVRRGVQEYLVGFLIANDVSLLREYEIFKRDRSSQNLTQLLNILSHLHGIIANSLHGKTFRKMAANYLRLRVAWELAHNKTHVYQYIPFDSEFYQRICINLIFQKKIYADDLTTVERVNLRLTPSQCQEDAQEKKTHDVGRTVSFKQNGTDKPAARYSVSKNTGVDLASLTEPPTTWRMICPKIFFPQHHISALGQFIFNNAAKAVFVLVDKCVGDGHKSTWLAKCLKLPGLIMLGISFVFFALAKLTTITGLKEVYRACKRQIIKEPVLQFTEDELANRRLSVPNVSHKNAYNTSSPRQSPKMGPQHTHSKVSAVLEYKLANTPRSSVNVLEDEVENELSDLPNTVNGVDRVQSLSVQGVRHQIGFLGKPVLNHQPQLSVADFNFATLTIHVEDNENQIASPKVASRLI